MTTHLKIAGMSCGNCVKHVRRALENVTEVRSVAVSLEHGFAQVQHEGARQAELLAAVEEEGYEAVVVAS